MGLFDKVVKKLVEVTAMPQPVVVEPVKPKRTRKPKVEATAKPKRASKKKVAEAENPAKLAATKRGEPWVDVVSIDVDPEDPGAGSFELDWNDTFVAKLVRAGYQGKTDQDIVDNWFRAVCRNVVLETWEQEQADPSNRPSNRRDLGNGRTEIS